jgi:uncharacterized RDD family membrane protein YckC
VAASDVLMAPQDQPLEPRATSARALNPFAPPGTAPQAPALAHSNPPRVASIAARTRGAFTDACLGVAMVFFPTIAIGSLTERVNPSLTPPLSDALIIGGCCAYLALQGFLVTTRGQSVGKIIARTKIVRVDGTPVDLFHGILLRSWFWAPVQTCVPFAALIDALAVFRADRRTVHDWLADTRVVEVSR